MLSTVYPNYKWIPWRFQRPPKNFKDDPELMMHMLAEVEMELKIVNPEDWYRISGKQLEDLGLRYFLTKKKSL